MSAINTKIKTIILTAISAAILSEIFAKFPKIP